MDSIELSDFQTDDESLIEDSLRRDYEEGDISHGYTSSMGLLNSSNEALISRHTSRNGEGRQKDSLEARHNVVVAHSEWYRGWRTILLIVIPYLFAIAFSLGHYILFRCLDGKPASNDLQISDQKLVENCPGYPHCEKTSSSAQVWVTTGSVFLGSAFTISLRITLTIAFTQILWKILRSVTLRINTIEALFNIRSNPHLLCNWSIMRNAFVLVLLSIFLYSIPLAASFPAGALTIKSISPRVPAMATIPTFNASSTGNGTVLDASHMLFAGFDGPPLKLVPVGPTGWIAEVQVNSAYVQESLQRLAATTSLTGKPLPIPSPCGPNCTYSYEFEGPSLNCSTTTRIVSLTNDFVPGIVYEPQQIYSGVWYYFNLLTQSPAQIDSTPVYLNLSVRSVSQVPYQWANVAKGVDILGTETNLSCAPYRSVYSVTNSYTNNIQTLNYSVRQVEICQMSGIT